MSETQEKIALTEAVQELDDVNPVSIAQWLRAAAGHSLDEAEPEVE